MYLVDSHCHIDTLEDVSGVLARAKEQGVQHMLCVCITLKDFPNMMTLVNQYPHLSATVGLHPNEPVEQDEPSVDTLIALSQHDKIVAIGETGLDYYRSQGDVEWQRERFRTHIRAAHRVNKPLIVHTRQAKADTLQVMREEQASTVSGVMHCFTEDWDMAKQALDLGFYISFSGIVTFRNAADIQDVAKRMPLDRMLVETDSPYLAPLPHRGKPNEPSYVRHVVDYIGELRGVAVDEIARHTTDNFFTLFKGAKR